MRINRALALLAMAGLMMTSDSITAQTAELQRYSFMVFSNPVEGKTRDYENWYRGQHIHDILQLEGFVAAQFYQLADIQARGQPPKYRYLMIWEIQTSNLNGVFDRMRRGMDDGSIVMSAAFDNSPAASVFQPISRRVTSQEVRGKSPDQVLKMTQLQSK